MYSHNIHSLYVGWKSQEEGKRWLLSELCFHSVPAGLIYCPMAAALCPHWETVHWTKSAIFTVQHHCRSLHMGSTKGRKIGERKDKPKKGRIFMIKWKVKFTCVDFCIILLTFTMYCLLLVSQATVSNMMAGHLWSII